MRLRTRGLQIRVLPRVLRIEAAVDRDTQAPSVRETEGAAVCWSSDRDGALGTGDQLLVADLRPGWHEITVTATDDDENTGSDTIGLHVGYRTYLPTRHCSATLMDVVDTLGL